MGIYKSTTVQNLELFYDDLLYNQESFATISSHLRAFANRMWEGYNRQEECVLTEISNYHPDHLGRGKMELVEMKLSDAELKVFMLGWK